MLVRSNFLNPLTNFVVALFGLETMLTSATQTMQELSDNCFQVKNYKATHSYIDVK